MNFKLTFRSKYRAADIEKKKNSLGLNSSMAFQKAMKKN